MSGRYRVSWGQKKCNKNQFKQVSKGGKRVVVPHSTLVAMRSGPKGFQLKLKV
jgi:hypothetical protein